MSEDDGAEKPFEATPRKLEEARRRGEAPISQDMVTFGVYLAILFVGVMAGAWSLNLVGLALLPYIAAPDRLAEIVFRSNGRLTHTPLASQYLAGIAVWFVTPVILALSLALLQGRLGFYGQKIKPKLSRVSIAKNAKQKFGADGLFNFLKSFTKLIIFCAVLGVVSWRELEAILGMPALDARAIVLLVAELCFRFLVASTLVVFVIGVVDFLWQRSQFLRRQRMSLKELKDELKETEGDPFTKQARRQKAFDIATNQMLSDVPGADVVLVNPEHYAVALKWSRTRGSAPVCVAKGVDAVAFRIRTIAIEHGVPVYRDPPTARALFSATDIGDEIAVEHYQAVAAAVKFADAIRDKARTGR